MDTTFIYFLKDPINPLKGYIGKTDRPRKRLSDHFTECRDKRHRRANWLKALATHKLKPTLQIVDEVPFEYWPQCEVAYIEFFLEQGYELVNGTPGGEGVSFSGKKHTKEFCAAMTGEKNPCFGRTGEKHPMFGITKEKHPGFGKTPWLGKKHKPESLVKMSVSQKGKKHAPEWCEAQSLRMSGEKNPNFGKPMSAEQKAKISATKLAKKLNLPD